MINNQQLKYSFYFKPGLYLTESSIQKLSAELQMVGRACFYKIPEYQCFVSEANEFKNKIIVVARNYEGQMIGFCSALLIDVKGVGKVLHLGLTCVLPGYRNQNLTHKLMARLIYSIMKRRFFMGRIWVTNLACVLSSLGNVALNFDNVFPSPNSSNNPSNNHCLIANEINSNYRNHLFVQPSAFFSWDTFVFKGSVKNTVFQKNSKDSKYYHRNESLNVFYKSLMNFEEGDEVLQVGHFSALTFIKYGFNRNIKKIRKIFRFKNVFPQTL